MIGVRKTRPTCCKCVSPSKQPQDGFFQAVEPNGLLAGVLPAREPVQAGRHGHGDHRQAGRERGVKVRRDSTKSHVRTIGDFCTTVFSSLLRKHLIEQMREFKREQDEATRSAAAPLIKIFQARQPDKQRSPFNSLTIQILFQTRTRLTLCPAAAASRRRPSSRPTRSSRTSRTPCPSWSTPPRP